jgi:DNA-binding NtrC family response regulator
MGGAATEDAGEPGNTLVVAKLRLEVIDGSDAGASRVFGCERIVIGSHDSADFVVRDSTVSRMHCELVPASRRVVVRDLESKNGTSIHGILVREATLTGTAVLELGHTKIRMTLGGDTAQLPLFEADRFGPLVGQSVPMRRAFALAAAAAASDAPVLLAGEPGTGKRALAQAIHDRSARAGRPLLCLPCGTMPRELLESELFGDERGPGGPRPGILETARGGSVVLDQVGELPIELQPRLLAALDRRELRRVGGDQPVAIDARLIATTTRNLAAGINGHRFRSDLHARLSSYQIALPPLRTRRDDLSLVLNDLAAQLQLDDDDRAWLLSPHLLTELGMHHWPGNLGELRRYVEGCVAWRAPSPIAALGTEPGPAAVDSSLPLAAAREAFDRGYAVELLRRHAGDLDAAAGAAGVDRVALCHLLWRLGIR